MIAQFQQRLETLIPRLPIIILIAYILLAFTYSVVTPMYESPDESEHFGFVQRLTESWELPVIDASVKTPWQQEGSQPPLYYFAASLVAKLVPVPLDQIPPERSRNPHAWIGVGTARINQNSFVHSPAENFPWRGLYLRFHLVRFFSIILGAFTVYAVYRVARLAVPQIPAVAPAAMAFVAFNPMFVFLTSSVNNDNSVILFNTLAMWLILLLALHGFVVRRIILLSIVLALACLSKLSGLTLYPVAGAVLVMLVYQRRISWQTLAISIGTMVTAFAVISLWWYVRNWQLYGDPTGLRAMISIVLPRPTPYTMITMLEEMEGLRISFWALFGWLNVIGPTWFIKMMDVLTIIALIGGIVSVFSELRHKRYDILIPLAILGLQFVIAFVSLINWTRQTPGTQGRLLFPAIAAIATLTAFGWFIAARTLRRNVLVIVPLAIMAVAAITSPFTTIAPAYAAPPTVTRLPDGATSVDVNFGKIHVVGFRISPEPVAPGGNLPITVYYQGEPDERNLSLFLDAIGLDGIPIGKIDTYPGSGNLPTSTWTSGLIYADTYLMPISAQAEGPSQFTVEFGWWDFTTKERLKPTRADGSPLEALILRGGSLLAAAPVPLPVISQKAMFSGALRLNGYSLTPSDGTLTAGTTLDLVLHWEALTQVNEDFSVFVHVEDTDGKLITQDDGPPRLGTYPTSAWAVGHPFADPRLLKIDQPGTYRIVIGLYRLTDGTRLLVDNGGDSVILQTPIVVK
jgi:4-amino-4-deoxy-L-arabinose transferase-like glycosyltransferase